MRATVLLCYRAIARVKGRTVEGVVHVASEAGEGAEAQLAHLGHVVLLLDIQGEGVALLVNVKGALLVNVQGEGVNVHGKPSSPTT